MNNLSAQAAPPAKPPTTLFDILGILWRWRWVIVGLTVLGFVVAAGYTMRQTTIYEAQASTLLQRQSLANSFNNVLSPGAQASEGPRVGAAQAQIARSPVIAARTLKAVPNSGMDVGTLLAGLTAEPDANSDVLHLKLQDPNGPLAVRLINEYAAQYVKYSTELSRSAAATAAKAVKLELRALANKGERGSTRYQQLDHNLGSLNSMLALTTPTAQVVAEATGFAKVKPKLMMMLALGTALGLGIGLGMAFVLEALSPRLRRPEAIAGTLGLPLLATLPRRNASEEPVTLRRKDDESAEGYRTLLAAAENVAGPPLSGVLLVTADTDPQLASAAAVNLALANARAGHETTLVDIGFTTGVLTELLGAGDRQGISDVISGGASPREARLPIKAGEAEQASTAPLNFIPVGGELTDAASLIGSDVAKSAIREIAQGGGLVIVDTGATADSSGAISAASIADHTLLVAATEDSGPQSLADAARSIALGRSEPLGVVTFS